jgi:uncharacterized membrane protein
VALLGPQLLRERSRLPRAAALGAALAGAAALVAVPLARRGELDAGWLWQVSARGPQIAGTSWLFWLLVPAGSALLVALVARARDGEGRVDMVAAGTAVCFLASTLAIGFVYQKYVDPFALVIVALAARPGDFARPAYAGAVVLGVAFVLYAATFRAERNRPDAVARAEPATIAPAAAARFGGAALRSRSDG